MSVLSEGSATARVIAQRLIGLRAEADPLVTEETASLAAAFLRESRSGARKALAARVARASRQVFEALTIPGLVMQYAVRKRWIEDQVRAAIADGVERVVVIGAGYDALTATLAREGPELTLIELDHPGTQAPKRRALAALGLTDRVELIPVDLERTTLTEALGDHPTRTRRTIFVAEGLLMYFDPPTVAALLGDLRRCAPAGSLVAFSFMEPDVTGALAYRGSSRLARAWLTWRGEPLRWGIARQELATTLRPWGLTLRETVGPEDLRGRYLAPDRRVAIARGEALALAEV